MDKVKVMVAVLERLGAMVAPHRASPANRSTVVESPAVKAVVLSERDSRRVAALLENPPVLSKGLRKAIDAKYR